MIRNTIFALFLLYAQQSSAQAVVGVDGSNADQVRMLVVKLIQPILTVVPTADRKIAHSIEIRVVPGGPWPGPRAGLANSGKRIITIPELYIDMQNQFPEIVFIAEQTNTPHLAERWTTYALWRLPPVYDHTVGGKTKSPIDFFGYSDHQKSSFYEKHGTTLRTLASLALADVLLHEIGHHVTEAFYNTYTTPSSEARTLESRVDAWASNVFELFSDKYPGWGLIDKRNLIGRMISILFLSEMKFFRLTANRPDLATHPPPHDRLEHVLSTSDCAVSSEMKMLCNFVSKQLSAIDSDQRNEIHYDARADAGEVFALYQLAQIRMARGDHAGACEWLSKDVGLKGPRHGYVMLGWCYAEGYLGNTMPDGRRLYWASEFYCESKKSGWVEGAKRYDHLILQSNITDHCD